PFPAGGGTCGITIPRPATCGRARTRISTPTTTRQKAHNPCISRTRMAIPSTWVCRGAFLRNRPRVTPVAPTAQVAAVGLAGAVALAPMVPRARAVAPVREPVITLAPVLTLRPGQVRRRAPAGTSWVAIPWAARVALRRMPPCCGGYLGVLTIPAPVAQET